MARGEGSGQGGWPGVCYITDDLSTDKTVEKIKEIIKSDNRFVLIENTKKMYQPGNYDQVIQLFRTLLST